MNFNISPPIDITTCLGNRLGGVAKKYKVQIRMDVSALFWDMCIVFAMICLSKEYFLNNISSTL